MKKFALLAVLFVCGFAVAQLQQSNSIQTVVGSGRNADYRTAVYEALVQAASQVQGVSLQDSRDAFMDSAMQAKVTSHSGEATVSEVRESLRQSVSATTRGRVLSYQITAEKYIEEMGLWFIELEAKVPGQYTVGLPVDNRRRMTVMPFRMLTSSVTLAGVEANLSQQCDEIAEDLNQDLTQTRRFSMLDRANDELVQRELARLNDVNSFAGDAGRSQQLLITDYMVTGTVKLFSEPGVVQNEYTGSVRRLDGPFVEVSYRVILVPTSQLKWAGKVVIPYSACYGSEPASMLSSGYAAASRAVCDEIVNNIYPLRVTAHMTYELVLNQGGSGIAEGDVYDVFRRGEYITDVSSGETLGAPEEMIARVRITRVDPKMSYAIVIEGTPMDQIEVGAVVRRPRAPMYGDDGAGVVSPVKILPGGAVKPPWAR